jgi:hypothetical protein
MKITTIFLAAYICFLMSQPALVNVNPSSASVKRSSHSCCASKKETKKSDCKDQSKNKCANGICNPFGECTCCLAISPWPNFQFNSFVPAKELIAFPSANLSSHYLADCFHPPEPDLRAIVAFIYYN